MSFPSFATGEVLTATDMNAVGFWRITPTAVSGTNSTLSGSTIVMNGSTEAVVQGVFTSNFDWYQIVGRYYTTAQDSFYQNVLGTTPAATNYNRQLVEAQNVTISTSRSTAQTSFVFTSNSNGAFYQTVTADIFAPQEAEPTGIQVNHCRTDGAYTVPSVFSIYGNHSTATAYDGFRIFVPSGTMTGKLRVYGYRD